MEAAGRARSGSQEGHARRGSPLSPVLLLNVHFVNATLLMTLASKATAQFLKVLLSTCVRGWAHERSRQARSEERLLQVGCACLATLVWPHC